MSDTSFSTRVAAMKIPSLPPGVVITTLENGLTVIVLENHATPIVSIELDVKNGSYTEEPDYNGLSHLYEHMFFKANASIPSQERYMERIRELGAEFNGTKLLSGGATLTFQVGPNAGDQLGVTMVDGTAQGLGLSGLSFATQAGLIMA